MNQILGPRGMTRVIFLCLLALATNAVLIQTVAADDSTLKTGVRVGVLVLAALAVGVSMTKMPTGIMLLALHSAALLLLRGNPDQLSFIFIFVLTFALFAVKERSLEKAVVVASAGSLALVFVFLSLGITQDVVLEPRSRHTFGTNGVPFFFNLVYGAFGMLVFYFYKYRLRGRFFVLAGSVAAASYLFAMTDARGGYLSFVAFVVLMFLVPLLARVAAFRFIAATLPVICLAVSFYIATLWDNAEANALLSIRPILFERFISNLTPSDLFLSTSVKDFDRAVTIVDNSYLHLLVGGGLLMCGAFFVIFYQAVKNLFKAGRHVDIAFILATCMYFNSESILLRIENMFVIFFWYLILRYCNPLFRNEQGPDLTPITIPEREPRVKRAKMGRAPEWARPMRY